MPEHDFVLALQTGITLNGNVLLKDDITVDPPLSVMKFIKDGGETTKRGKILKTITEAEAKKIARETPEKCKGFDPHTVLGISRKEAVVGGLSPQPRPEVTNLKKDAAPTKKKKKGSK